MLVYPGLQLSFSALKVSTLAAMMFSSGQREVRAGGIVYGTVGKRYPTPAHPTAFRCIDPLRV